MHGVVEDDPLLKIHPFSKAVHSRASAPVADESLVADRLTSPHPDRHPRAGHPGRGHAGVKHTATVTLIAL